MTNALEWPHRPKCVGNEYRNRKKVGRTESCHLHHPWECSPCPRFAALHHILIMILVNVAVNIRDHHASSECDSESSDAHHDSSECDSENSDARLVLVNVTVNVRVLIMILVNVIVKIRMLVLF